MNLDTLAENWNAAACDDAMFNILTLPQYENGGWDPDAFFESGRTEVAQMLERLDYLKLRKGRARVRALDFGCGVGRITQALAAHYDEVIGVDVSKEMTARARQYADQYGLNGRVGFYTNRRPHLHVYRARHFDFIYTVITLQHMPQELQKGYIQDFPRLLKRDGLAVFQVPEGNTEEHENRHLSMYGTDRDTVFDWVQGAEPEGEVIDVELSHHSGGGWKGWRYTVRRKHG